MVKRILPLILIYLIMLSTPGTNANAYFVLDQSGKEVSKSEGTDVPFPFAVKMILPAPDWTIHYEVGEVPYPGKVSWGQEITWTEALRSVGRQANYRTEISKVDKTVSFFALPQPSLPVQNEAGLQEQPVATMRCGLDENEGSIYLSDYHEFYLCRNRKLVPLTKMASLNGDDIESTAEDLPEDKPEAKEISPAEPKYLFTLQPGSLSQQLTKLAQDHGYKLGWEYPKDILLKYPVSTEDTFLGFIEEIADKLHESGRQIRFLIYSDMPGNPLIVVKEG